MKPTHSGIALMVRCSVPDSAMEKPDTITADLPRLLAVAVGLPATIVVVDHVVIGQNPTLGGLPVAPLLLVAQVGVLGFCTGRYVRNVFLRCVIFAWSIVLVNCVVLLTMYYRADELFFRSGESLKCMTFAFWSGQVGLLTVWGSLGRMTWPWRLPIFLVALALIVMVLMGWRSESVFWEFWRYGLQLWAVILAVQSVVMLALCAFLYQAGYRLVPSVIDGHEVPDEGDTQFRFSIKHVVFWMTAVCPVLVLGKGLNWQLDLQALFRAASLGMSMAFVSWAAMLFALGYGSLRIRLLLVVFVPLIAGALLTWITSRWAYWLFRPFRDMGWQWIGWTVLAAWFLAALLLVFRAGGYRIARMRSDRLLPSR